MKRKPQATFVINSLVPYNQHLCRRLTEEIDQVRWKFVFTAEDGKWERNLPTQNCLFLWERKLAAKPKLLADQIFEEAISDGLSVMLISGYARQFHRRLADTCWRRRIPFFIRGDSNIVGESRLPAWKRFLKRRFLQRRLAKATGTMPMGTYGQQYFEFYGADPKKMYLVPHIPDFDQFENVSKIAISNFRTKNGIDSNRKHLLCCNRLVEAKNMESVIHAYARLAPNWDEWDLVILGVGPLESRLRSMIPIDISHRVHWLGVRQLPDVILAFNSCDIFILASRYEPWGNVISEAAAAGLAIVTSDVVGAARDIVQPGSGGRFFESENTKSLETELTKVMSDVHDYKERVVSDLLRWRSQCDPVDGIRTALHDCNIII